MPEPSRLPWGKSFGKSAARGALIIGRQAQMMPVLASMVVQIVDVRVPWVWSLDLELAFRVVVRRIEVTQTLSKVSTVVKRTFPEALTTARG